MQIELIKNTINVDFFCNLQKNVLICLKNLKEFVLDHLKNSCFVKKLYYKKNEIFYSRKLKFF